MDGIWKHAAYLLDDDARPRRRALIISRIERLRHSL